MTQSSSVLSLLHSGHRLPAMIQNGNSPAVVGVPSIRQLFCVWSLGPPARWRPGGSEPGPIRIVTSRQPPAIESWCEYGCPTTPTGTRRASSVKRKASAPGARTAASAAAAVSETTRRM